jgi:hypothetical protein
MNKMKDTWLRIGIFLALSILFTQPVSAWGELSHIYITSEINKEMHIITDKSYANGGSIGPDLFYFQSNNYLKLLSDYAHTNDNLQRKMFELSTSDQEKDYTYGWATHYGSDPGSFDYIDNKISSYPYLSHTDIEIGVDANLPYINSNSRLPYGLLQESYKQTFGYQPSWITIFTAAQTQKTAIYIEKSLINLGIFNSLKTKCSDYSFDDSIDAGINAINALSITGSGALSIMKSSTSIPGNSGIARRPDQDILDASNELLKKKVLEVQIEDDTDNKVFYIHEPVVKNKKEFDEAIANLAKKKKLKDKESK